MKINAAEVGEEPLKDVFAVLNGRQVIVGHDQRLQAGKHGAELADFRPVVQSVVCDVQEAQRGAGGAGGPHTAVLIKAQKQLLQPTQQQQNQQ